MECYDEATEKVEEINYLYYIGDLRGAVGAWKEMCEMVEPYQEGGNMYKDWRVFTNTGAYNDWNELMAKVSPEARDEIRGVLRQEAQDLEV